MIVCLRVCVFACLSGFVCACLRVWRGPVALQGPSTPCDTGSPLDRLSHWVSTHGFSTTFDMSWLAHHNLPDREPLWPIRQAEDAETMRTRAMLLMTNLQRLPDDVSVVLVVCHGGFLRTTVGVTFPNCGLSYQLMGM